MHIRMVYMTFANLEEARKIGRELVASKLAACVNILPQMHSIYFWEDKLQEEAEVVMIAKTTKAQVAQVIRTVTALHSYSCPCIVSLPVLTGHRPYLEWIDRSVMAS
jgi:periplasmic divalent cation tolerance protein